MARHPLPASAQMPRYLSVAAAARHLGYSPRTMNRMRADSRGPAYVQSGGRITYDLKDLDRWASRKKVRPISPTQDARA